MALNDDAGLDADVPGSGGVVTPLGPGPKSVTIYDVAAEAGVSPSTVSRAFSRPGRVSSRTAKHVLEVAHRMGYRTEEVFRAAPPGRTQMIGLALADITNPFFFAIIRGAEEAAAKHGYTLVIADTQESDRVERQLFDRIVPAVDGLVVASSRVSDTDLRAVAKTIPVAVLNRHVSGLPSVIPDAARGVRRAVEHLAELGHTRITYVAGPEASWADGARWRALREATTELSLQEGRIGPFAPTVRGGLEGARAAIGRDCRALLAYNDLMAMGIVRGLQAAGKAVPEDVSVVGFDNIFASDLITPGLTTVAAPLPALGDAAVRSVIAQLRGTNTYSDRAIVVPCKLIVRGSSGPA